MVVISGRNNLDLWIGREKRGGSKDQDQEQWFEKPLGVTLLLNVAPVIEAETDKIMS